MSQTANKPSVKAGDLVDQGYETTDIKVTVRIKDK